MPVFDQRGQKVRYQFNVAGDVNVSAVKDQMGAIQQLEKLQEEMQRAIQAGVFDEDVATDAEYQLKKATQQAKKEEPDKKGILDHINKAKTLIEGVSAAGGLVSALVKAAEMVGKLF